MAEHSTIEWTDATWTPIRARETRTGKIGWHCEHASEGCRFCYAEGFNRRLGTGFDFKPGHLIKPFSEVDGVEVFLDEKMLLAPLKWKKPRMIFVCSMTDAFAGFVKDEWLDKIFAVMALAHWHTFQVLTKRADRMRQYLSDWHASTIGGSDVCSRIADQCAKHTNVAFAETVTPAKIRHRWPLPNVWVGVSAEDQSNADQRIPQLLATPAAVRFVSLEPLLGPIDLTRVVCGTPPAAVNVLGGKGACPSAQDEHGYHTFLVPDGLHWIIVGGESGKDARPFHLEWADGIVNQCRAAGVACFVKQLGSQPMSSGYPHQLHDRKGGDADEWPARLAVREMPERAA